MKVTKLFAPLLASLGKNPEPYEIAGYMRNLVCDDIDFDDDEEYQEQFNKMGFEIVDVRQENGDYHDSTNYYVTIQFRDTDEYYQFLIQDSGQIGPECMSMIDKMYKVKKETTTVYR